MPKLFWSCERQGCFNVKKRLKLEVFEDLFPGKISMTDMDGLVEIGGQFLMLEWKSPGVQVPMGQRILFSNLPPCFCVLIVEGDAETMEVVQYRQVYHRNGKRVWGRWIAGDLESLRGMIAAWVEKVLKR